MEKGVLDVTETNKGVRPYFVGLQGVLEHVLSCELNRSVKWLHGYIYMPMPAAPFCTEGFVSKGLVDLFFEEDPVGLFTVKARTTILRDFLFQCAELFVIYPKDGLFKRSEIQQNIYLKELANYPRKFFDCPLECESIDHDLIGTYYIFKSAEGKTYFFAIKKTPAISPQDLGSFRIWFSEMRNLSQNGFSERNIFDMIMEARFSIFGPIRGSN